METKQKIKGMLDNNEVDFNEFYSFLRDKDIGNWDGINEEEIIYQYINEKMKEGIHVSHILKAIESHPSESELYSIWLGNSMETPTPINTKKDLIEALEIELKD